MYALVYKDIFNICFDHFLQKNTVKSCLDQAQILEYVIYDIGFQKRTQNLRRAEENDEKKNDR